MTPNWLKNWIQIYKNHGFKSLIKDKGWLVGFVIFMTLLELLVAFLQAYVFTLLSAIYFGAAVEEEH